MQFEMKAKELKELLAPVFKVVDPRMKNSALHYVLFSVEKDAILASVLVGGTDLTTGVRRAHTIFHATAESGEYLIPSKDLQVALRVFKPRDRLRISVVNHRLMIEDEKEYRAEVPIIDLKQVDYPEWDSLRKDSRTGTIHSEILLDGLSHVIHAVAESEEGYIFGGVFIKSENKNVHFGATNGRYFAHRFGFPVVDWLAEDDGLILPAKAVKILVSVLQKLKEHGPCFVTVDDLDQKIRIKTGRTTVVCKLISGNIPNYQKVLTDRLSNSDCILMFDRFEFLSVLTFWSLKSVTEAIFRFESNKAVITYFSGKTRQGEVTIQCEYSGNVLSFSINPQYVQKFLQVSQGESIILEFRTQTQDSPARIWSPEFPDYEGVLMVHRLKID